MPELGKRADPTAPKYWLHQDTYFSLGGAAPNFLQGIRECERVIHDTGETGVDDEYSRIRYVAPYNPNRAKRSQEALKAMVIDQLLEDERIDMTNIARSEVNAGFYGVSNYQDARRCRRDPLIKKNPPIEFVHNAQQIVEDAIDGADIILIDPSEPIELALMAAQEAERQGVRSIVDWGRSEWPEDSAEADMCHEILQRADILIVPHEAALPEMTSTGANAVYEALKTYPAHTKLMSGDGDDVRVVTGKDEARIPVNRVVDENVRLTHNAIGDKRNAALAMAIARGYDDLSAAKIATHYASLRIQRDELHFDYMVEMHKSLTEAGLIKISSGSDAENVPAKMR